MTLWARVADGGMDGWDITNYSHTSSLHPLRHAPHPSLSSTGMQRLAKEWQVSVEAARRGD